MSERAELLAQLRIDRSAPSASASGRRVLVAGVVLLALAVFFYFAFGRSGPASRKVSSVPALEATRVASRPSVLDASGYVTARRLATVSAKITGKVSEVLIEEGMRVEAGQVLARLDPAEAERDLALAQAQLRAAEVQAGEVRVRLANAERERNRAEELFQRRLSSQQAIDDARAAVDALRAQLDSVRASAQVAAERVRLAEQQLDNTIIRAPFAGVVIAKAAQVGEMVSPLSAGGGFTRTGIGTLVDMDSLEVQVDVNEAYIGRVRPGQPVEAVLNAYPDWRIPAEVIAIIPTADRGKATVRVRIALREKDARIVPDMGVRVAFLDESSPPSTARSGVLIPESAVRRGDGQDVVYVIENGRAVRRAVELGAAFGAQRNVTAGLAVGERVIVDPPADLADGQTVQSGD